MFQRWKTAAATLADGKDAAYVGSPPGEAVTPAGGLKWCAPVGPVAGPEATGVCGKPGSP